MRKADLLHYVGDARAAVSASTDGARGGFDDSLVRSFLAAGSGPVGSGILHMISIILNQAHSARLQSSGEPDHVSFTCHGAPAFNLGSREWSYVAYTWHTNSDTFDRLVIDDLRHNAVPIAMLAYQASEDPQRVPRERLVSPDRRKDLRVAPPACRPPARSWAESVG